MAEKAKTADRAKRLEPERAIPCAACGKPTRIVKRVKNRALGIAGGMYFSCTVCDVATKK